MRRLILLGTLIALVAGVFFLWQYRFERLPGSETCCIADLVSQDAQPSGVEVERAGPPAIRLAVDQQKEPVVARFALPGVPAAHWLLVKYRLSSKRLKAGHESWNDGRGIIEWRSGNRTDDWENEEFVSVREDCDGAIAQVVLCPDHGTAVPVLRLEHLGSAGEMELSVFEATALQEHLVWRVGRWLLMAGWLGWIVAWIHSTGNIGLLRPLLVGLVSLLMIIYLIAPGPWKILHSFGPPFQIGREFYEPALQSASSSEGHSPQPPRMFNSASWESVGEVPVQGDLLLRIKIYASKARPLLHSLLLFGPTFLVLCLIGRKQAVLLMAGLAIAIEAAEFSFGYGFDRMDVLDLMYDTVGIAVAVAAHQWILGRISQRWRLLISER